MDPHFASYGEEGFKRLIMASLDLRHGAFKAPTEFTINNMLYRNPSWPNGVLGLGQINILQEISKVVLDIDDMTESKDSKGWVDIEVPYTGYMARDIVETVRLHAIKLLKKTSYPISDVLTPYDATFKTEFGTYPKIMLPYYISTDRTVPELSDERTKNDWRLAWPIKEPGFEEGKDDIITSNQKAAEDMLTETFLKLPSMTKRLILQNEDAMESEFEKFKIKLRF
tara:strand:+ start:187 stop:864 length:678 start_codon:yes stop_codon:yes gene_type:complete